MWSWSSTALLPWTIATLSCKGKENVSPPVCWCKSPLTCCRTESKLLCPSNPYGTVSPLESLPPSPGDLCAAVIPVPTNSPGLLCLNTLPPNLSVMHRLLLTLPEVLVVTVLPPEHSPPVTTTESGFAERCSPVPMPWYLLTWDSKNASGTAELVSCAADPTS